MLLHVLFFILFINKNVNSDNLESLNEKKYKNLSKFLDITKNIKTWKTIGINKKLNNMYETMNYRMYNLQCTYAYYALNHINLILENENKLFLYWQVLGWHVSEILQDYARVALKTHSIISIMNYQPPEWMMILIKLLRKDISI